MAKEFGTSCESPFGAFIESPLGARDCPETTEQRQTGCCCYTITVPVPELPNCDVVDNPPWFPAVEQRTILECITVPESWFDWARAFRPDIEWTRDLCIFAQADRGHIDPSFDNEGNLLHDYQVCDMRYYWVESPECLGNMHHTGTLLSLNAQTCPNRTFASWQDNCRCTPISSDPNEPPPDLEEQCDHTEGYCCLLVLGQWELSPEGQNTWARFCTANVQQQYFDDPIQDVHFDPNPDDPVHPCPPDPFGQGWCCVTMLDGQIFHANPTGDGSTVFENECTIDFQQEEFDNLAPGLGLVVVAVQWLGQVGGGCIPCKAEGSCCLGGLVGNPPRGVCMTGLTEDECDAMLFSEFNPGIDACTNCFAPSGARSREAERGRCCTTFDFDDGAQIQEGWNCRFVTEANCAIYRQGLQDDDRFSNLRDMSWTLRHECRPDLPGDSAADQLAKCSSLQGWCCPSGFTGDGRWRLATECAEMGDTFYGPNENDEDLCTAPGPCCVTSASGDLECIEVPWLQCDRLNGMVAGEPGTTCGGVNCEDLQKGWCCAPGDTDDAAWRTLGECAALDGVFHDPNTDPNHLCEPKIPCCVADGDGVVGCQMLKESECEPLGGIVMGEIGDDCNSVDGDGNRTTQCEVGACCLGCSRCADNMPEIECTNLGGEYRGHGTQCHQIPDCPEDSI